MKALFRFLDDKEGKVRQKSKELFQKIIRLAPKNSEIIEK